MLLESLYIQLSGREMDFSLKTKGHQEAMWSVTVWWVAGPEVRAQKWQVQLEGTEAITSQEGYNNPKTRSTWHPAVSVEKDEPSQRWQEMVTACWWSWYGRGLWAPGRHVPHSCLLGSTVLQTHSVWTGHCRPLVQPSLKFKEPRMSGLVTWPSSPSS